MPFAKKKDRKIKNRIAWGATQVNERGCPLRTTAWEGFSSDPCYQSKFKPYRLSCPVRNTMPKQSLSEQFANAEQLVAKILKDFPETRANDRELILKIWDLQGFRIPQKLLNLYYKVLSPESIRRTRQKLQAMGLYRADSLKTAQRSLRGMEFRDYFRGKGT